MRRDLVAAVALTAALVAGGCSGDDGDAKKDDDGPATPAGEVAFAEASEAPCLLLTDAEVAPAVGADPTRTEGDVCTWRSEAASGVLTLDLFRAVEGTPLADLAAPDATPMEGLGDEALWEVSPGADSGRATVRQGGGIVSVSLIRPGYTQARLEEAARTVLERVLTRLGDTAPEAPQTTVTQPDAETCELITADEVSDILGQTVTLGPEASDGGCGFGGDGPISVVVGPQYPDITVAMFDANRPPDETFTEIGGSVTDIEGLGDRAFAVRRPTGTEVEAVQLVVLDGTTLLNITVQDAPAGSDLAEQLARAVLDG